MRREPLVTGMNRDLVTEILRTRRGAVETEISALLGGVKLTETAKTTLLSLDGQDMLLTEAQEIFTRHKSLDERWIDAVNKFLGHPRAKW